MNKRFLTFSAIATLTAFAFFLSACKKDKVIVNVDKGEMYQDFLPLTIGKYIVYDVDSSIWVDDNMCTKLTNKYQHKYTVADTFRDNQNRLSYTIEIKTRKNESSPWKVDDVIYYTPAAEKFETVQKNIRTMNLVNPIQEGKVWEGNSLLPHEDADYNWLKGWKYTYLDVLKPFNNGFKTFEKTITVEETDQILNNPETLPDAYASILQSKKVYAFRVGMIYKKYINWTYDPIPGSVNCRNGIGVEMRAIDYN
jgi:hypothetical protein